ncbi:MAG TPA: ABC transporter substrate-binding protein [Rhizobiaceae bacterium]|nr:ABC transporter substrate-binding protein [Rhizobiaceae bacterium]
MRLVLAILAFALASGNAAAADKVTVLLDWFVNPDHAAFVIAKEKGMFEKAGLDVEIIAPADPSAPPRLVAAGQGDLAVTYQPQLHVQVGEGLPLVRIATIAETPLNALVVLQDGPVKSIADLKGKTVGFSVGGFEDAVLAAMLNTQGLSLSDVTLVNVNFALSPSLFAGKVDAVIGAFRNFELNQMDIEGRPGTAFYPEENGVPAYDELVLVARKGREGEPQFARLVGALEEATLWLTNHPGEAWEAFVKAHPDLDNELNRRAWRDTLPRLAKRPAALDRGRYHRFAQFMQQSGLIDEIPALDAYAVDPGAR